MMDVSRLEYLFDCYLRQACSKEEEKELMTLIALPENEDQVQLLVKKVVEDTGAEIKMPGESAAAVLQKILQKNIVTESSGSTQRTSFTLWKRIAVAAAIILFMAGTAYWFFDKKEGSTAKPIAAAEKKSSIVPGGDRALLTMADGSIIVLDSIQNGTLQQGNAKIKKQNGLLIFNGVSSVSDAPVAYNTLSTPRGGQYQVVLPDGSKVWLNASSSLYFPTAFTGNDREVVLTGEAYFEVAKNKDKPFRVKVGDMQVNVLGTHFDVNAYADESSIKTSLLEGSVKLIKGNAVSLLKPGQQGVLIKKEDRLEKRSVDMSEVVAWKNGLFQFDNADITTIMKQISRWYDVEITYSGSVPVRRFAGKISRDAQLSDVLKILELSDVKFTVEGRKIVVRG